jgi:hypothetical protein
MARGEGEADPLVRAYKTILNRILDQRPSGTRQRLADVLGKNRSFVTQITSPAYATPVPHKHVETILAVCHAGPAERASFLAAYRRAHHDAGRMAEPGRSRQLSLTVPDFGDDKTNAAFDRAISDFVARMSGFITREGEP